MEFDRISSDPKVMVGKPCIKGTRITVDLILERLSQGATHGYLLEGYPHIAVEDIHAVLAFARNIVAQKYPPQYTSGEG